MEEKLKQINEFQIQSDKEEKDEQVKLSKEFYEEGEEDKREGGGEKDKEEEDGEEEYGNYDIENLEKVKSQRLE